MLEGILQAFNLVDKVIKKENVLKANNTVMGIIQEEVLPVLKELNSIKSKKLEKSEILDLVKNIIKIQKGKTKDFLKELEALFLSIDSNRKVIEEIIVTHASSNITDKAMSAKDSAIVKLVDDLTSLTLYSLDLVVCMLSDANNTAFPKIKFKQLKEGMTEFVKLFLDYSNNLEDVLETVVTLDDTVLSSKTNKSILEAFFARSKFKFPSVVSNGFINNPFYHIRMYFVDRDMAKLDALKDKKKLIELRIMELKLENKHSSDPDLEKRIEYFEDKLAGIEYSIAKLED